VLGFALRLRGVLALHASAVLLDGRAVALVGPSGSGKSTAAAAFASAGVPVLSDDVLAVRRVADDLLAYPSYRLLRLWVESEQMLFGTTGALPLLTPTWDKRALPLGDAHPFHPVPAPLGDVFLIAPRVADARAPYVEPVAAGEALLTLVLNTYANYLLDERMRGEELRALEGLMHGRRVRRLVPHANPARLGVLVELVRSAAGER
jgi:energy-coupling factor transporter ATP-binding protein EcfA2